MAEIIMEPRISLEAYLNAHPLLGAARVELLGAFMHFMMNVKKITTDTATNFDKYLEEFKTKGV